MPRKILLTWRPKERRWRKRYRGQYFYFPAKEMSKEASYPLALAAYHKWRAKVDEIPTTTPHQEEWEAWLRSLAALLAESERDGEPWEWRATKALYDRFAAYRDRNVANPLLPRSHGAKPLPPVGPDEPWNEMREPKPANGEAPPETLEEAIGRFLRYTQGRVGNGISHSRYANLLQSLNYVRTVLDCSVSLSEVGEREVSTLHAALLSSGLAPRTAHGRQANFWAFLRFAAEERWIESLPRNVGSRRLAIRMPAQEIETVSDQDLGRILKSGNSRVRLWTLLALNCGFTQVDLGELQQSEVDWTCGRIRRKRSKTDEHASTPTIEYELWPETFSLMQEQRSDHPELVFLARKGLPLVRPRISAEGRVSRHDTVSDVWPREMDKLGYKKDDRPEFRALRRTVASKLNSHPEHARFARPFLGRSPQGIDERHYLAVDQAGFDCAVEWLGEWVRSLLPT